VTEIFVPGIILY